MKDNFRILLVLATVLIAGPRLQAREVQVNSIGMKLVPIMPGEFLMGAGAAPPKSRVEWDARDWDEAPEHKVILSQPFFMSATEVTNSQYELFDPEHKTKRGLHGVSTADDHPVVMVSWQEAVDFCQWLSKKEGKTYRLPTEAEWEYACRAGTTTPYNTGDTLTPEQANFGVVPQGKRPGPAAVSAEGSWPVVAVLQAIRTSSPGR
jgi:sulfatase modifying factor 1